MKKLIPISTNTPLETLIKCSMCQTSTHMKQIVKIDQVGGMQSYGISGQSWSSDYSGTNPHYHEGSETTHRFYCAECGNAITVTIRNERNSTIDEDLINHQKDIRKIYQAAIAMFLQNFPGEGIPSIDSQSTDLNRIRLEGAMSLLTRVMIKLDSENASIVSVGELINEIQDILIREEWEQ